jgi:RNA polymerase primary sigma factor
VVADPGATLPSERLVQETDLDLMREILSKLPERERTIVALRFGLGTDSEQTLEEVGARFGLTRERIRQIQEQALKKMRAEFQERNQPNLEEDDDLVVRS